ncbi:MAG: LemA family protein [bacterium]|nr:LemA family protein [bacterium]
MNKIIANKALMIVGAIIVILVLFVFGTYNGLVGKSQAVDGQWAQVETQYQRRFDLIPNLVESVKGFMVQEKTIFEDLAKARAAYAGARNVEEKVAAANTVETGLSRLLAIIENYPQLKSNETVARLMDELAGTENRISVERKRYNDTIRSYNITIKTVPTNFVAGLFGFKERVYFQAEVGAEAAPKVKLTPEGE